MPFIKYQKGKIQSVTPGTVGTDPLCVCGVSLSEHPKTGCVEFRVSGKFK